MLIQREFQTLVCQRRKRFINQSNRLPIQFKLFKTRVKVWCPEDDGDVIDDVPMLAIPSPKNLVTQETINISRDKLPCNSTRELICDILSSMLVHQDEHPPILAKIFHLLDDEYLSNSASNMNNNTTMLPIVVGINVVTWWELRSSTTVGDQTSSSDMLIDWAGSESMQTYEVKLVPADKSFIEHLEKVRLDDLDLKDAASRRPASCAICMEDFEAEDHDVQVNRLPCLHLFHGDCIVQWLETSHLCPLCRYPMPRAL